MIRKDYDCGPEKRVVSSELETLKKQQARRDKEPLLYRKLIANHPRRAFFITLGCQILMMITTAILFAAWYDVLPFYMDDLPAHLHDQPWQGRVHAFNEKTTYDNFYDRTSSGGYQVQQAQNGNLEMYYEMKDETNVFIKENLMWMEQLENQIAQVAGYEQYCQLDPRTNICQKPVSVIRYFDGTFRGINETFYDPTFDNINDVLTLAATHPQTKVRFAFFLGVTSRVTETGIFSPITRSIIPFGYPVKKYVDDQVAYILEVGEYTGLNMDPILRDHLSSPDDNFRFTYRSQILWAYFARTQAFKDIMWVGASIAFIFLLILFHTRSLWITSFAVVSVISSFVITNLIYNLVMQFHYLGFFHMLSLFIVLGIGADDFFVFYDVWRNTGCEQYLSVAHRLSDTYRKSAVSMLFTSLTTAVAFFANTIIPVLSTRSFGLFAGTAVIVNYLSVIIFFPSVVLMYHTYFENWHWPCIRVCLELYGNKKKSDDSLNTAYANSGDSSTNSAYTENYSLSYDSIGNSKQADSCRNNPSKVIYTTNIKTDYTENKETVVITHDFKEVPNSKSKVPFDIGYINSVYIADEDVHVKQNGTQASFTNINGIKTHNTIFYPNKNEFVSRSSLGNHSAFPIQKSSLIGTKKQNKPLMARFFREKYFQFVTHKYLRWLIFLVMAGVLGFFIYQATKLEADNELFSVLPDDHYFKISERHRLDSFVSSYGDETLDIFIIWGLKKNDMSICQFSEAKCDGRQVIDHSFEPNSVESQTALKTFCDTLENMDDARANLLRLRKNQDTQKYEIRCFFNNMENFLKKEQNTAGEYLDFPYTKDKVLQFMRDRPQFYNASSISNNFTEWLEIPISYWLSNKYTFDITDDLTNFDPLIGEEKWANSLPLNSDTSKFYGNKIRYIIIEVNTTIKFRILSYEEGIPIRDEWEKFMDEELAKMPVGLKHGFQTDRRFRWHWISVQRMLIQNAIYGLIIGVCVAFPILVIATGNIIVGTLATFSLCCCTVCVIGVIPLGGWKLGALESLNMCMVVGLSVDYVVHLAQAYSSSLHTDRLSRVQDMLDEMATSIFFGAITTLGAAMFMFFTLLSFFKQFATFMFSTIGFSLLFSMCLFTALMGIIGPQNETGNLRVLFKCCGKRK